MKEAIDITWSQLGSKHCYNCLSKTSWSHLSSQRENLVIFRFAILVSHKSTWNSLYKWSSGLLFLFPTSPHEILCVSMNIQENGSYRSYGRVQSMHVHCQLAYHKILLRASTYKYLRMEIICKFNACVAHEPGLNKAQLPPTVHPGMHNFVIKEQSMWASKIRHFKYRPWLRMHN
jgi:hypothetical protein